MEKFTKQQVREGQGYLSSETRDQALKAMEHMPDTASCVNFAYSDYGGDLFDRACIKLFEDHPQFVSELTGWNGENGLLYGDAATEFWEAWISYPFGVDGLEEVYDELVNELEEAAWNNFISDLDKDKFIVNTETVKAWLQQNKSGYYTAYPTMIDFSSSDLEKELLKEGVITENLTEKEKQEREFTAFTGNNHA